MDIAALQALKPAPAWVFDDLERRADRPRFLVHRDGDWRPVTWGRFAADIDRAAAFLSAMNIGTGDRVAVFGHNSVAWATAALAIQRVGAILVPIYPSSSAEQVGYVLDHAGASAVFVDGDALRNRVAHRAVLRLDEGGDRSWTALLEAGSAAAPVPRDSEIDLDAIAMLLYTSGTSGPPKGVPLSHRNLGANGADWLQVNAPLLHEDAVDVLWLPLSHVFGFGELCLGNMLGFTTYLSSPADVLQHLPEVKPTVFFSVPAYWEKLARGSMELPEGERPAALARATGGRLRFCLSGGAGLKREVKELFQAAGTLIIEGYGLTECSPTLTLNRADDFRFDSVGKPLPSVDLRLDADGEILARGPNVFSGYFRDPAATRAAFTADGWFRTGDIGRFTDDGFLQIVDRKKDIIVTSGGKNVAPANVELRFLDEPLVEHVVVYGDGKRYLVAGVWPSAAGRALQPTQLRERIAARIETVNEGLASCETIKRFAIFDPPLSVEGGLLTASMKIRRKHIYEAYRERFESIYDAGLT